MKPARFDYARADSKEHALQLLASYGDSAKVLAGGQSLGPLLNMRLAVPSLLVDINGLAELTGHHHGPDATLTIGSLTRHRTLETDGEIATLSPLLAEAAPHIGHRAIRNRGTIGGSLAHADPAAELPAVTVALGATIVAESTRGVRRIAVDDFFDSYYTSTMEPDEMVTGVIIPPATGHCGTSWVEYAPRRGDYGYVGVAATLTLDPNGRCTAIRLVFSGIAGTPVRATLAERLIGTTLDRSVVEDFAYAVSKAIEPAGDAAAPVAYKRRLMRHLTRLSLLRARGRAGDGQ